MHWGHITIWLAALAVVPNYIPWKIEEARDSHDTEITKQNDFCIDVGGSSIGGHVNLAAIFLAGNKVRRAHMGTEAMPTVYPTELRGISLTLIIASITPYAKISTLDIVALELASYTKSSIPVSNAVSTDSPRT